MQRTSDTASYRSAVVVDASLAVRAVLPLVATMDATSQLAEWRRNDVRLIAPALWLAECTSAIRGLVHLGHLTRDEGHQALGDIEALEIELIPITHRLARDAFEWAERIGQRRAYDGFYLALAEQLCLALWSADRRLVRSARSAGADWVHWVGTGAD